MGLTIGRLETYIAHWGLPAKGTFRLREEVLTVAAYPAGTGTLSQPGEIFMLMAREGFQDSSMRGITIGSTAQDVLTHYGLPSRQVEMTQGQSWAYDAQRIAFQLRAGKVVSWLVF